MKKEPVCIAVVVGASIAQALHFYLEVDPTIVILVEAAVFLCVRQFVIPHIPSDILETMSRLAKGTEFENAHVLSDETFQKLTQDLSALQKRVNG